MFMTVVWRLDEGVLSKLEPYADRSIKKGGVLVEYACVGLLEQEKLY
jgi:hypothetical protein